ncbi:TIGR02646 family protein [Photobacterium carnosum]|uniref:retron system putative HNH endonuclease n=1 Tax=Photobacterium carnosum TaxID=2023717 RepID=UPI001E2E4713|nr:retron system putative HNH endonuclease [Photobacterium carnosum]MCD9542503.1 TIGR02646 family protein [Photobacterium carnosum]
MKIIIKTELGSNVLDRQIKQSTPQNSEEATSRWNHFSKKNTVRNKLISQQKGICGYTEFNIKDFKSKSSAKRYGCHIEHIKPKDTYPEDTFNYNNLIISILDDLDLQKFKKNEFIDIQPEINNSHTLYFGGHAKGNNYNSELFITPVRSEYQKLFTYIEDNGEIVPEKNLSEADKNKVIYTISLLNLNHPYLMNQRKKRMAEVLDDIDNLETLEQQIEIIKAELMDDEQGEITSFPSAISSLVQGV